ncbi:MAG: pyrroline-5-carboxylate reductase [Candidatus Omnitrophota bacterium]|jgi:pyrroline-5-carboxylate reductase
MKIRDTIGLAGVGNMGRAILEGLLAKKIVCPSQVRVYDKITARSGAFGRKWKVAQSGSLRELARDSRIVVLAFKPQDLREISPEAKGMFGKRHCVISILAGTPIANIRKMTGSGARLVRAMPNLGATVGESVTALCGTDAGALGLARKIFSGCGTALFVREKFMDLVTAVSGSGPAYFFLLMEVLMKECAAGGLSAAQARALVIQTAVGSAKIAGSSAALPGELRERVTSKGGTTAAALEVLARNDFEGIFRRAVRAARRRGRELSRGR